MSMRYLLSACFTVLAALATVGSSSACVWCGDEPILALTYIQEQVRSRAEKTALIAETVPQKGDEWKVPHYLIAPHKDVAAKPKKVGRFYTEYLTQFYPQAPVIIDLLLPTMCSQAARAALRDLVQFISEANWHYFVNDSSLLIFEQVHVRILQEQLASLTLALKRTTIERDSGLITVIEANRSALYVESTIQTWQKNGEMDELYDLYALQLDLSIRLAYLGVLHNDYLIVVEHYEKVQRNASLVVGSKYEQVYAQAVRLYSEILKMLRQRLWDTDTATKKVTGAEATTFDQWASQREGLSELSAFAQSFVTYYECNTNGKLTHEYHPFLLDKTGKSLVELEQIFEDAGISQVGRLMLMGYEEQGVPRYYTDFSDAYFTDEIAQKTAAGWSVKQYNRFGLLTGFLCKHANDLATFAQKTYGKSLPLTHINPDMVEIFDGFGTTFQEHAFGDAYHFLMATTPLIEQQLAHMAMPELCRELLCFWQTLYNSELRITGKQHVVGTEDILFSIAYVHHLQQSKTPILHFYMGPDITYPIETSSVHKKEVTRHAQTFVNTFVEQLVPRNGKKTGYVFCSFVDGVGKSTMLGNVQNWMKYGADIEKYEHVDNSSSQLATVFDFSDQVVIADLPAQVSHFTFKPDGFVYVDTSALNFTDEVCTALESYVVHNKTALIAAQDQLLVDAATFCAAQGYDLLAAEKQNPELSYALNVLLLKKQKETTWCSFSYEGNYYLFDRENPFHIRMRVPLETAPSHGLKNPVAEQMIFTEGVRFPLSYKTFTSDLVAQLKEHGVEQVVMVDFLSMYSRSSRENIRVNYIIQQLALLHDDFSLSSSLYQSFVNNEQLLAQLEEPHELQKMYRALLNEAETRTALYEILKECEDDSIVGVSLQKITEKIKAHIVAMPTDVSSLIRKIVQEKIKIEYRHLHEMYAETREYVAVQQFRALDLVAFSQQLAIVFTEVVRHDRLNELWGAMRDAHHVVAKTIMKNNVAGYESAILDNGTPVRLIARISPDCKDRQKLLPLLRQVRAMWWATLSNLLYTEQVGNRLVVTERFPVPPLCAYTDETGMICIVIPEFEKLDELPEKLSDYGLFEVQNNFGLSDWGAFGDVAYLLNWDGAITSHASIYGYGHEVHTRKKEENEDMFRSRPIVSAMYIDFAKDFGDERVLTHERLSKNMFGVSWNYDSLMRNIEKWQKEAQKNGYYNHESLTPKQFRLQQSHSAESGDGVKRYAVTPSQRSGIRFFLRGVATLDMVAKDLETDFASRRGNREDFIGNIRLMQTITLPWLYGLVLEGDLFNEAYEQVAPLMGWDYFEKKYSFDW